MEHISGNPFIYGGPVPPSYFIGREDEVRLTFDQVASPARGSVAISGDRRIGKTSLLQYVCDPTIIENWGLSLEEYLFVYLDCPTIGRFTPSRFWQRILTLLLRQVRETSPTSLVETIEDVLEGETITNTDFEIILDEIYKTGRVLALLLDEFEWVIDPEDERTTRVFLSGLRALTARRPRMLSLIVATREELTILCRLIKFSTSPFYNNFVFKRLRPFTKEEVNQLIDTYLKDSDIAFTNRDKEFVYEVSGGHPYWAQHACYELFERYLEEGREKS